MLNEQVARADTEKAASNKFCPHVREESEQHKIRGMSRSSVAIGEGR